jgi:hypothetical protein
LYSKSWKTLKKILAREAVWRQRVKDLKLGKGTHGTLAAQGTCSKGKRYLKSMNKGCRAPGAGRKDLFKPIKQRLKIWLEKERSLCHHVDKTDLVEEFIELCEDDLADVAQEKKRRTAELENKKECAVKVKEDKLEEHAVTVLQGF